MQLHNALAAVLATAGVAGESFILRHSLVNTYPFKVFTYPSPEFFALAGNVLAPLLVAAFALAAVFLSRRSPIETPLLLTVLLPVVFALAVSVVTVISHGLQVPAHLGNFDGYTIGQALGDFSLIAVALSVLALFAGGLSSALVALVCPAQGADG
ncbi:MAG TPA: hypothetical protein VGC13_18190 [Longimicrobium sp.]|jgi:hypothetical protein|uniref:hypothetical protein n=1 Tax=Longimicrobium sp. TaxID=2029185 RepID=UPI002EDAFB32